MEYDEVFDNYDYYENDELTFEEELTLRKTKRRTVVFASVAILFLITLSIGTAFLIYKLEWTPTLKTTQVPAQTVPQSESEIIQENTITDIQISRMHTKDINLSVSDVYKDLVPGKEYKMRLLLIVYDPETRQSYFTTTSDGTLVETWYTFTPDSSEGSCTGTIDYKDVYLFEGNCCDVISSLFID